MNELSASRIKVLDDCKLLFYRKYIVKDLPEDLGSPFADMGKAVHKALEVYRQNPAITRKELIAIFDADFKPTKSHEFLIKEGRSVLYRLDFNKVVIGELISVEFTFEEKFGNVLIRGVVDKMEYVDDTIVITDYKTNKEIEPEHYLHQLAIYDLAMERLYPGIKRKFELFYVRHNKVVPFEFLPDYWKKTDIAVTRTIQMITENQDNPSKWPKLKEKKPVCSYCPLIKQCWR